MTPEDERLIADLDDATARLRKSLKTCRKILDTYRPRLTPGASNEGPEPPLFDWTAGPDEQPTSGGAER